IALVDDLQRQLVYGRAAGAAALSLGEKLLLGHFSRLRVVGEEHDLNVVVASAQKPDHPEKEAPRHVRLERSHRARRVHHRYDDIGRASCRERVEIWVDAVALEQKKETE